MLLQARHTEKLAGRDVLGIRQQEWATLFMISQKDQRSSGLLRGCEKEGLLSERR